VRAPITKQEALQRITARWLEQCAMFPTMRLDIPLHLYVSSNLAHVMRNGLFEQYAMKGAARAPDKKRGPLPRTG
jgi:hypothetical protein